MFESQWWYDFWKCLSHCGDVISFRILSHSGDGISILSHYGDYFSNCLSHCDEFVSDVFETFY